jgi:hypothetical protein
VTRAVLVPGTLALLPAYASLEDPVAELRAACRSAVAWLGSDVTVLADPQGARVAAALLGGGGSSTVSSPRTVEDPPPGGILVVGNGSAMRTEKAPGHLDERSHGFDAALGAALSSSDAAWPSLDLGNDLWASLDGIRRLRDLLPAAYEAVVDYDDDPFGVQYWVMRWEW